MILKLTLLLTVQSPTLKIEAIFVLAMKANVAMELTRNSILTAGLDRSAWSPLCLSSFVPKERASSNSAIV